MVLAMKTPSGKHRRHFSLLSIPATLVGVAALSLQPGSYCPPLKPASSARSHFALGLSLDPVNLGIVRKGKPARGEAAFRSQVEINVREELEDLVN
jgi:hypothetical protein